MSWLLYKKTPIILTMKKINLLASLVNMLAEIKNLFVSFL